MPPVTPTQALKVIEQFKRELAQVHEQAVVLQRDLAAANRRIAELVRMLPLPEDAEQAVKLQADLDEANRRIAELEYQVMPLSPSGAETAPAPVVEPTSEPPA